MLTQFNECCIIVSNASVEKLVYSADLKSAASQHGGSTPPTRTKCLSGGIGIHDGLRSHCRKA